ncbi:MAG: hypothetical protein JNJ70_18105 [Verrucomicrobiales bacterium]|nr:hypothetical protein [Verrucomicrobiales bacterium]
MSEFILQIESLLSALSDPEYRYLALEPLITYGLLTGVILVLVGYFAKAPRLEVAALVVIGVAALTYFPYKDARTAAQPRMEQVYKIDAKSRVEGFAKNSLQWQAASWQFKLLVVVAFATLMIGVHRNRIGLGLAAATLLLALLTTKQAMWLNYQDALAYHPNLKRHDAPIDRRTGGSSPAPRERTKERNPAPPVAQPVTPAAQAPAPAPATTSSAPAPRPAAATMTYQPPVLQPLSASSPYSYPSPAVDERVAPPMPPQAPQVPLTRQQRARQVQPLPRY